MKAMILVLSPKECCDLMNGDLSVLVRKKFSKDYVGWVYIYCTKNKGKVLLRNDIGKTRHYSYGFMSVAKHVNIFDLNPNLCGKVVARFWCDKVEEITTRQDRFKEFMFYETSLDMEDLLKQSCLDYNELDNYLYGENGYAIHITNLEIFDKPKEISEFKVYCEEDFCHCYYGKCKDCAHLVYEDENYCNKKLTRAPQNYCYVEV